MRAAARNTGLARKTPQRKGTESRARLNPRPARALPGTPSLLQRTHARAAKRRLSSKPWMRSRCQTELGGNLRRPWSRLSILPAAIASPSKNRLPIAAKSEIAGPSAPRARSNRSFRDSRAWIQIDGRIGFLAAHAHADVGMKLRRARLGRCAEQFDHVQIQTGIHPFALDPCLAAPRRLRVVQVGAMGAQLEFWIHRPARLELKRADSGPQRILPLLANCGERIAIDKVAGLSRSGNILKQIPVVAPSQAIAAKVGSRAYGMVRRNGEGCSQWRERRRKSSLNALPRIPLAAKLRRGLRATPGVLILAESGIHVDRQGRPARGRKARANPIDARPAPAPPGPFSGRQLRHQIQHAFRLRFQAQPF